ncbi:MAG: phosphoglucosamine mutase [Candidatus Hadarchaeales archaeon]
MKRRIFGTSGVRGAFGPEMDPRLLMDISLSLSEFLSHTGKVLVGRDTRTTGGLIEGCVVAALSSGGCDVLRAGVVPTPALSFGVRHTGASAGVMVTASHNPPEYNGLKFWRSDGCAFDEDDERRIEKIYWERRWAGVGWKEVGAISSADVLSPYLNHLESKSRIEKEHLVAVDCGNGAASLVTPLLLRRVGCRVRTLNSNPDGFFPGRPPEPSADSLAGLAALVKRIGAEVGIAHDGDADRTSIVDERGRLAQPDRMLALVASHMVRKKGDIVVTTVDASSVVDEAVTRAGGVVVRTGVGDVKVAAEIKRRGAVFGGEPSGAWIFPHVGMAPDGPMGAMMTLELMEASGTSLSHMLDSLPEYPVIREKVQCPSELRDGAMDRIKGALEVELEGIREILTVDGIRMDLENGWVLVRPSGTEPLIRITVEGKSTDLAREIMERTVSSVKNVIKGLIGSGKL